MDNFNFENKKKKKLRKEPIYIAICILCLAIGGAGGYFYRGKDVSHMTTSQDDTYSQISQIIESGFFDTTESEYTLKQRMIGGMVAGLGDIHTTYLSGQQSQELKTSIDGSFVGIGITFTTIHAGGLVLDVYKGTPAQEAGILAGDLITRVEGTSVAGYTSDKIKSVVQGEKGTEVALTVLRNGKPMEVKVKRNSLETSAYFEVRQSGSQKIGYLCLTTFGEDTDSIVENALKEFKSQKIENIVIDLRDNGGGYLDAAKSILDMFIPEGEIMVQVESKNGNKDVYKAKKGQKYSFEHGYILVDGSSASASEVMTGALKDILNYQVVGEKTYGKGTVQTQKTLSDSSVLKYTTARWLTPKGTWVNGQGITPDYEVKMTTIHNFHVGEMKNAYKYDQVDDNIKYMQEMLKELGYQVDRQDGYFSKATQNALTTFEKNYGLKQDGVYDENDATILLSALAYHVNQELEDKVYQKVEELVK